MKIFLLVLLSPVFILLVFFLWASYPWRLQPIHFAGEIGQEGKLLMLAERPTTLSIMSWNMAYGYGIGSEGNADYLPYDRATYEANLQNMCRVIQEEKPDVLLLQEIDFDSQRSHFIDQVRYLAQNCGLTYWAKAPSWINNYVPFPYWPMKRQFGAMNSGGAILSRFPIKSNAVHLLPKPLNAPWWYNLFYLFRYCQEVEVDVEGKSIKVANVHLEAFDRQTREEHARWISDRYQSTQLDFLGGDFNLVPKEAMKKSGFANPDDDYENDNSWQLLSKLPMTESISATSYQANEETYWTFPADNPDRRLDYVFYGKNWTLIRAGVVKAGPLSDHLPFKVIFQLFGPTFIKD